MSYDDPRQIATVAMNDLRRRWDSIENPAWDLWQRFHGDEAGHLSQWDRTMRDLIRRRDLPDRGIDAWFERSQAERELRHVVSHYMTFTIPTPEMLRKAAEYAPILEVGAGTGYWAWCLRQMFVDVLAVDAYPPRAHPRRSDDTPGMRLGNRWFESYWPTEVVRMDAAAASSYHSNRTLLMVWPPIDDMADRALRLYRGDHVIYVGEISPACANDAFFEQLGAEWKEIDEVPVPQWENIHDEMIVYRRTNDAG